jgi:hypothetical protein
MIAQAALLPDRCYWARRLVSAEGGELEIVQISAVFGPTLDYFSVAIFGSDQHYSLNDFEFLLEIEVPGLDSLGP